MPRRGGSVLVAIAAALVVGSCSADVSVTAQRSDRIARGDSSTSTTVPEPDPPTSTDPVRTLPPRAIDPTVIDTGPDKPARDYDDTLAAVVTDLHVWWDTEFPRLYAAPFRPIEGSIYAAYPTRPDDIPGCGTSATTSYDEVREYVAFYCGDGDFIVYDDGDDSLLVELAAEYGNATIATVLAHEFAHAVQQRIGVIDRGLPTIVTEQQADCMAGAWTARAANGGSSLVQFSGDDVRAGLIAMTKVSDPVGIDQFDVGGHGSAFDRVGAFQVGFLEGLDRCVKLLADPLPLVPNEFVSLEELETGGDADFGFGEADLMGFLPADLNAYWADELDARIAGLDPLPLVVIRSMAGHGCDDLRGDLEQGVAYCAETEQVLFYEPAARQLYDTFGDFSVGYLLGTAWSAAVLDAVGSTLTDEARALAGDCLTGGWVKTVIPVDSALPMPRLEQRTAVVSAGDLDEAIQTVLLIADERGDMSRVGSAFAKIDALRQGVINGTDYCLARL